MKGDLYTCALCKGEFRKGQTEEEANKELEENFSVDPEDCELVCNDCYNEIMKPLKS